MFTLRHGTSSNIGGVEMLHGYTSGQNRLGRLGVRGMNGYGLGVDPTNIDPNVVAITQEASYLTNWYNQLFPTTQQQQYVPIQTGAVGGSSSSTMTILLLGGLAVGAFLLLK